MFYKYSYSLQYYQHVQVRDQEIYSLRTVLLSYMYYIPGGRRLEGCIWLNTDVWGLYNLFLDIIYKGRPSQGNNLPCTFFCHLFICFYFDQMQPKRTGISLSTKGVHQSTIYSTLSFSLRREKSGTTGCCLFLPSRLQTN